MNQYLNQALKLLSHNWQSLGELKKHYDFIVWESLVYYGKAEMKIKLLGRFGGCRHYFRLKG